MSEQSCIHVMIVDDHTVVRKGIVFSLLASEGITVLAEAGSGEEALRLCAVAQPDVVLMDVKMPGMGGIEAMRALHDAYPQVHVIALTSFEDADLVQEALAAGAIAYLLKDIPLDELVKAIRLAHQGVPTLAPAAAQALVRAASNRPPVLGHDLTAREREVLALLAEGQSNQQIADRLIITPATVKFHTRSIRSKLGTSSRTQTIVVALQQHLVGTR
jgi:two-component system, NarL family, response regulator LiaR